MPRLKSAKWCAIFLALALLSLPGCANLALRPSVERVKLCQQERTAEVPDWPEALEDFPAYAVELLAVIREERMLERVERECMDRL